MISGNFKKDIVCQFLDIMKATQRLLFPVLRNTALIVQQVSALVVCQDTTRKETHVFLFRMKLMVVKLQMLYQ